MNNKLSSPLYIYTKTQISQNGIRNIGKYSITKAYNAVNLAITDCCVLTFHKTKNSFLNGFYSILNTMSFPKDIHKAKEVRKILEPIVNNTCC